MLISISFVENDVQSHTYVVLQNLITFVIYLVLIMDDVGKMFQYIHNRSDEE